jgi:hypothetical protein
MCLICRFIVTVKSPRKYNRRIGQNTGIFKKLTNVHRMATSSARVMAYLSRGASQQIIRGDKIRGRKFVKLKEVTLRARTHTHTHTHVPELELRESPDERLELVVGAERQRRCVQLRVYVWREEADKKVQDIDAERVADNVPAAEEEHAQHINEGQHPCEYPASCNIRINVIQ